MTKLILLPGMDGSGIFFRDFVAALSPTVAPMVVSYPVDDNLGYSGLEALVQASLPGDQSFILVGESFSGPIAIAIASRHPPGLAALVLVCTFARSPLRAPRVLRQWLAWVPHWLIPVWMSSRFLLGQWWSLALRAQLQDAMALLRPVVWRARMRAAFGVNVDAELRRVRVPALYLRASNDRVVPRWSSESISRNLPSIRIADVDGPHFLLQAKPAECAAAVREFARETGIMI